MLREKKIDLGDITLNVAEGPDAGPPLVLLHGVCRSWTDFLPLIPVLELRWHVWAVDLRGHGFSGPAASADKYRVADYASDIVRLLSDVVRSPAAIFGHSLGSMIAAAVAGEHPKLVTAVVLEDPPMDVFGPRLQHSIYCDFFAALCRLAKSGLPERELFQQLAMLPVRIPGTDESVPLGAMRDVIWMRMMARSLTRMDPAVLEEMMAGRWLSDEQAQHLWQRITCPALILQGNPKLGGMCTDEDAAVLGKQILRGDVVRLDNQGHLIHSFAPQETLRLVTAFLEAV